MYTLLYFINQVCFLTGLRMADKIQVTVRVRPVLFQNKDVEIHWASEQGMVF